MASNEPNWHPDAIVDADEAKGWYAERSPLAAHGFVLAIDQAVAVVMEAPERWPLRRNDCRRYVLPNRYPFDLIYRLGSNLDIQIVAIAHHKRRPDYWRDR